MYSIGEVAKKTNISPSTLRYYEKEGLLPSVSRTDSGIRKFDDDDLDRLSVIECLKKTGMPIKKIKQFIDWCSEGDSTIKLRYEMFLERREETLRKIEELKHTLEMIDYKCWYYETACKDQTEDELKKGFEDRMPEEIRKCYQNAHE